MALVTEKGIEPPNHLEIEDRPNLLKWFLSLWSTYPRIRIYEVSVTPGTLTANSITNVTVTVTGISTNDILIVNKPSFTSGVGVVDVYATATDTVDITFICDKGSPTTPPTETYRIVAIRK